MVQSFNNMTRNLEETTVSRNYFNTIISSMQESLIVLGENGRIKTVNSATCTMLEYSRDELMDKDMRDLFNTAAHDGCIFAKNNFGEKPVNDLELEYMTKDGRVIPVLFSAAPMENMDNDFIGIVCLAIDISKRKEAEEELKKSRRRLEEIAITDELTHLLNRRGFMTLGQKQLQVAKRLEGKTFLMYADVDNLKWINDNLGHHEGDKVIQETAMVLRSTFRDADIIGRLGGDEFAVLFADAADEKTIAIRLEETIDRINQAANRIYKLSLSLGVVRCDFEAGCTLEHIMTQADSLMYEHKEKKKSKKTYHPAISTTKS